MKTKYILPAALCLPFLFSSCLDSDDNTSVYQPTAIVTVCPDADESFVMQLDPTTKLVPVNLKKSPFGAKEVRALVNYTEEEPAGYGYDIRNVHVNWIDSIRTKEPEILLPDQNVDDFGSDPVEIVKDWVTVAEDGYLTLRIRTVWGYTGIKHRISLITGTDPDNPFDLELRHDADGDTSGNLGDALIAFNLNKLPRTTDGTEKITLRWKSFEGDKTTTFDIQMRSNPAAGNTAGLVKAARID